MLKGVLAGILIGIGATAYVLAPNTILGAALFSLGLISVFHLQADLFTGKIGGLNKFNYKYILLMLLYNFVGISLIGLLMRLNPQVVEKCRQIVENKVDKNILQVLIDAFMCGILIQLAVDLKKKDPISTILCIMTFILCGFEHCVANVFYFVCGANHWLAMPYLIFYILGNSLGGVFLKHLIQRSQNENNSNR